MDSLHPHCLRASVWGVRFRLCAFASGLCRFSPFFLAIVRRKAFLSSPGMMLLELSIQMALPWN